MSSNLPVGPGEIEKIVALVDDELCGYITLARDDERFQWTVTTLAAGSPRVDATDSVSIELWASMLEFAVKEAGRAGARRLFGTATPGSAAHRALERAGFAAYMRFHVLRGRFDPELSADSPSIRALHESDAWSVHQLYHRITPRPVQFAEARTSDWWIEGSRSSIPGRAGPISGFVVDAPDGLTACCRIQTRRRPPLVTVLSLPEMAGRVTSFVACALERCGVDGSEVEVVVPDYAQEIISKCIDAGLWIESERIALVRHTTVPRVVHPAFETSEVEALARQHGVRGVPNLTSRSPDPVASG